MNLLSITISQDSVSSDDSISMSPVLKFIPSNFLGFFLIRNLIIVLNDGFYTILQESSRFKILDGHFLFTNLIV